MLLSWLHQNCMWKSITFVEKIQKQNGIHWSCSINNDQRLLVYNSFCFIDLMFRFVFFPFYLIGSTSSTLALVFIDSLYSEINLYFNVLVSLCVLGLLVLPAEIKSSDWIGKFENLVSEHFLPLPSVLFFCVHIEYNFFQRINFYLRKGFNYAATYICISQSS